MATDLDLRQAETIAKLPPDLMLLKMENESIMAVARAAPRDPVKIVKQLQELIDAYPAAADEAIYSKPVGTVIELTCGACGIRYEVNKVEFETICPACDFPATNKEKPARSRKVKKYAEGLSIRAAESIRSIYGYTRLATTTEMLDDGKVRVTGVLVDYAAGNVTSDERIVSPMYRSRGGRMDRTPEDRFLNVVVKAEKAKLRRDVILDNTPNIVKAMFLDACEKKLEGLVPPEVVEQKIIPAFAEYGIGIERLEQIIGRSRKLGWRERDRLQLRKILTALKNDETTVRELLDGLDESTTAAHANGNGSKPATSGTVTAADLTKPRGSKVTTKPAEKPAPATGTKTAEEETAEETADATDLEDSGAEQAGDVGRAEYDQVGDGEHDGGEQEPPPEWEMNLGMELEACIGIRDSTAVGEKYCGQDSPLSKAEKAIAAKMVADHQARIRASRGGKGRQGELLGG